MKSVDNIIVFPKIKRGAPANSIDEIMENVETARKEQVEFILDDLLTVVFERAFFEGFKLADDGHTKATALLVESFRAALYKTVGIFHPLHEVAESVFVEAEAIATVNNVVKDKDIETEFE